ncbi:MAG: peptide chain release factor N(5)-glutamine methyltransferase [Bacteroidales bacterium]|nr:peptide chain release factor N(5)-glutamine methyltransferase [Bacteroidales bacterium]
MLLKDFIKQTCESLEAVYPAQEARSIVSLYCSEVFGVQSYTHILEPDATVPEACLERALSDSRILAKGCPVQQVIGYARFRDRKFRVTPDVLIPRPETEMLVQLALDNLPRKAKVLDLCTGSGCIAWSVCLEAPDTEVTAVDLSSEALEVARSQFEGNGPRFIQADILQDRWWEAAGGISGDAVSFDLLISNPPYIMESEKKAMRRNVLDYEPEMALFVPDSDPLLFYRAIADTAASLLKHGATGLVEINESLGKESSEVFCSRGFRDVQIVEDLFGKQRFIRFSCHNN